ncbi:MAG: hypothetical protein AAGA42_03825, partial [Actinomycetota bacterium]
MTSARSIVFAAAATAAVAAGAVVAPGVTSADDQVVEAGTAAAATNSVSGVRARFWPHADVVNSDEQPIPGYVAPATGSMTVPTTASAVPFRERDEVCEQFREVKSFNQIVTREVLCR